MIGNPISLRFAEQKTALNWAYLLWAYRKGLLTWKDLIHVADAKIMAGSGDVLEIELAGVEKNIVWNVAALAEKLAGKEVVISNPCLGLRKQA